MPTKKRENEETEKSRIALIIARHWWKFAILILCGGLAYSGYNITCGKIKLEKQQIKFKGADK